ncbi:MAG: TIGR04086 family membrane protein [Clostridia bacterium]|nr:TIGR04086 family membrane protein [Clostridia bacterium]
MDKLKSIMKGIIISYIITIVFIVLFSLILVKTNIKEQYINTVVIIISSVSILIGTSISTIKLNKHGIINGIIISSMYMIILYVFSSILNQSFLISINTIIMFIVGIILGILGGIIGVNIKS